MVVWALVVGWCPWLPGSDWALCWAIFGSGLICLPELRSVLLAALPVWVGAALPNQFGGFGHKAQGFQGGSCCAVHTADSHAKPLQAEFSESARLCHLPLGWTVSQA